MVDFYLKNKDKCPICNNKMKTHMGSLNEVSWCKYNYDPSISWKDYHYCVFICNDNRAEPKNIEICYKLPSPKEHLEVYLWFDIIENKVMIRWYDHTQWRRLLWTLVIPKLLSLDFPELSSLKKQVDNYFNLLIFS